jgi:hypothetical protein
VRLDVLNDVRASRPFDMLMQQPAPFEKRCIAHVLAVNFEDVEDDEYSRRTSRRLPNRAGPMQDIATTQLLEVGAAVGVRNDEFDVESRANRQASQRGDDLRELDGIDRPDRDAS